MDGSVFDSNMISHRYRFEDNQADISVPRGQSLWGTTLARYGAYPSTARTAPARMSTVRSTCSSVMTAAGART